MPLRRTGDPWEVLQLAVSSLRLIGGILLMLAALGTLTLIVRLRLGSLLDGDEIVVQFLARTVPYILAGGCFLGVAHFLKRRHSWAAVVAICLTSGACLVALLLLGSMIVLVQTPEYDSAWMAFPILVVALIAFALGRLVVHLTSTFQAMREIENPQPGGGFEPVGVLPVLPPPQLSPSPSSSSSRDGDPHASAPQG